MTRDEFVISARALIGTPFQHQGRTPHTALDCAGLVVCAARSLGVELSDRKGYADIPNGFEFIRCVEESCVRIPMANVQIGDLLVFAWTREPQHIAIVSKLEPLQIIHSWSGAGMVVENRLDEYWKKRLRRCYRLKALS